MDVNVGNQSSPDMMPLDTVPAGICPGHFTIAGREHRPPLQSVL